MKILNSKYTYLTLGILLFIVVLLDIISTEIGVFQFGMDEQNSFTSTLMQCGMYYPMKIGTLIISLIGYYFATKTKSKVLKILVIIASIITIVGLAYIDFRNFRSIYFWLIC